MENLPQRFLCVGRTNICHLLQTGPLLRYLMLCCYLWVSFGVKMAFLLGTRGRLPHKKRRIGRPCKNVTIKQGIAISFPYHSLILREKLSLAATKSVGTATRTESLAGVRRPGRPGRAQWLAAGWSTGPGSAAQQGAPGHYGFGVKKPFSC